MKFINHFLSGIAPALVLPLFLLWQKSKKLAILLFLLLTFGLAGCFLRYYKTNTVQSIDAETLQKLISTEKKFILHSKYGSFLATGISVKDNMFDAQLETLSEEYQKYLNPVIGHANHMPKKEEVFVTYQVHLYLGDTTLLQKQIHVPLTAFNRIDVYGLDKSATNSSTVVSIIGLSVLTLGFVGGILVLAACNCPQVYSCTNNSCAFTGGLYRGAIYKSLERTDYMPLSSGISEQQKMHLRIGSVDGEEQIMNSLSLLRVTHAADQHVLIDRHGKIIAYRKPVLPDHAWLEDKQDIKEIISSEDGKFYSFTSRADEKQSSSLQLKFKKPAGTGTAKLLIKAKNSAWSGYLFREFKSMFGSYYPKWTERKDNSDPQEMFKWQQEQALPLSVSIKENGGWKKADYFITPGNTAEREMIMQLDLSGISEENDVTIRLQTAYMFWDLDYAAMDFSGDENLSVTEIAASRITKQDGKSQEALLEKKDSAYLHLSGTEYVDVEFSLPATADTTAVDSWFLESSGYYHFTKQFSGEPKIKELKAFLEKGAFDRFSRQKFSELQGKLDGTEQATAGLHQ